MENHPPDAKSDAARLEALKKTARISLEEALSVKPPQKKTTSSVLIEDDEKNTTAPITGIPTHTSPIPQTIRLKRPATSPIVINPPDITSAPTVVKLAHAKVPTAHANRTAAAANEAATIIKKTVPPGPANETSRIILDIGPQMPDTPPKTGPMPAVSTTEPTPGPKTIRLKTSSTVMPSVQMKEQQPVNAKIQTAKKSETSKIEIPKDAAILSPATQRKTIKIKRSDRNIIPRTVCSSDL